MTRMRMAMGGLGLVVLAGVAVPLAAQTQPKPTNPTPQWPTSPAGPQSQGQELAIPAGTYNALVLVGGASGGRARLVVGGHEFGLAVPANATAVVPLGGPTGWVLNTPATLRLQASGMEAWGMNAGGPVRFEPKK
ncbi:MAG TPA: hypothetical protein VD963_02795 [Phycisphaerales bacterium]|nr:hypothetical protein [Phycisphaerales bacterium]